MMREEGREGGGWWYAVIEEVSGVSYVKSTPPSAPSQFPQTQDIHSKRFSLIICGAHRT